MNPKLTQLSRRYATILEKQLKEGPRASLAPAQALGWQAVSLGLETLDLAQIHEQALATLKLSDVKNAFTKLAAIFFSEANTAIEDTHCANRQTQVDLNKLMSTLSRRTKELAASKRHLRRSVVQRTAVENAFARSRKHHQKCLKESLDLQSRLRHLTHQMLAAQEDERKQISRELRDEVAQTLLGINVRLLCLKSEARGRTERLKNNIAGTQRLLADWGKSVQQAGGKICIS